MNAMQVNETFAAFLNAISTAHKAHLTLQAEAKKAAPALKVATEAERNLFLHEVCIRVAPRYPGAQVVLGRGDRPRVDNTAAMMWISRNVVDILKAEGVSFVNAKNDGESDEQEQAKPKESLLDKCYTYCFKLLNWKQFRKLGERIIAACDAHDAGEDDGE